MLAGRPCTQASKQHMVINDSKNLISTDMTMNQTIERQGPCTLSQHLAVCLFDCRDLCRGDTTAMKFSNVLFLRSDTVIASVEKCSCLRSSPMVLMQSWSITVLHKQGRSVQKTIYSRLSRTGRHRVGGGASMADVDAKIAALKAELVGMMAQRDAEVDQKIDANGQDMNMGVLPCLPFWF